MVNQVHVNGCLDHSTQTLQLYQSTLTKRKDIKSYLLEHGADLHLAYKQSIHKVHQ